MLARGAVPAPVVVSCQPRHGRTLLAATTCVAQGAALQVLPQLLMGDARHPHMLAAEMF